MLLEEHFDVEMTDESIEVLETYKKRKDEMPKPKNFLDGWSQSANWSSSDNLFPDYYLDCTIAQFLEPIHEIIKSKLTRY